MMVEHYNSACHRYADDHSSLYLLIKCNCGCARTFYNYNPEKKEATGFGNLFMCIFSVGWIILRICLQVSVKYLQLIQTSAASLHTTQRW